MHQVTRDPTASASPVATMWIVEAMERARARDCSAFEKLYEHYRKPLGQRLMYLVGDKEVAYDLYQDTFARVWTKLAEEGPIENFEAWLYSIAKNLAIDYLRRVKRITFLPLPEGESSEPEEYILSGFLSVSGHEERICELACIQQALEKMSPQYRTCVLLQEMWGYSQHEIAHSLKISEKSVSANVSRGRAQLRIAYREMLDELNTIKGERKS